MTHLNGKTYNYDSPKQIYLIRNLINDKIYIGQSNHVEKRYKDHTSGRSSSKYINADVKKFGKDNFELEILETCCGQDFRIREKFYIEYYKTQGFVLYNQTKGGEEPPTFYGENHPRIKYTDEQRDEVINRIISTNKPFNIIAKEVGVSKYFVARCNIGKRPKFGLKYPLREEYYVDSIYMNIINDLKTSEMTQIQIAHKYGVARSEVTMINIGKNHKIEGEHYPIRKKK